MRIAEIVESVLYVISKYRLVQRDEAVPRGNNWFYHKSWHIEKR